MKFLLYLIIASITCLSAIQVSYNDIKLLSGKINYKWKKSNFIAILILLLFFLLFIYEYYNIGWLNLVYIVNSLIISIAWVWGMSKINSSKFLFIGLQLLAPIIIGCYAFYCYNINILFPFAIFGFYYRNCPFGSIRYKSFLLFSNKKHTIITKNITKDNNIVKQIPDSIPNFSYAGCKQKAFKELSIYDVSKFGILPNTDIDVLPQVQQLIDKVGQSGGGCIYFPKGKYLFNKDKKRKKIIQINYSNITLKVDLDQNGNPLSELIN